ncbi:hypothetical protein ACNKU7_02050 [Microbulbifer sp. SA54]|uniref:hypothetical protein n=1 Tax=Microbulbifer sp. SA54 TaxID=3401577 RepID=UPI003AAF437D
MKEKPLASAWFVIVLRQVRRQNLIRLIASALWLLAALSAMHANFQPFENDIALFPLVTLTGAVALLLLGRYSAATIESRLGIGDD